MLQMSLLFYAASNPELDKGLCAGYLDGLKRFHGRGNRIANWIWQAPVNRIGYLKSFARRYSGPDDNAEKVERQAKRAWCRRLFNEIRVLFKKQDLFISEVYDEQTAPPWQIAGAKFLNNFYDELKDKFPGYLFSEPNATDYNRQDLLRDFVKDNNGLYVCAVCDEIIYYTKIEDSIRTDIDHYLPRYLYPHFSCHPYNLVPICLLCNEAAKSIRDPLLKTNGERRHLNEIFLPYWDRPGLGLETYVDIGFVKGENDEQRLKLKKLVPYPKNGDSIILQQKPASEPDIVASQKLIDALEEIYRIPHRWDQKADNVGETLFRRMRQFLQGNETLLIGDNTFEEDARVALLSSLDQLLYCFRSDEEGDLGKGPFTFSMASLLATLINDEIEPGTSNSSNSPLLQEITFWYKENKASNLKRALEARRFRDLIKTNNTHSSTASLSSDGSSSSPTKMTDKLTVSEK
jgi:hypothetical protein